MSTVKVTKFAKKLHIRIQLKIQVFKVNSKISSFAL